MNTIVEHINSAGHTFVEFALPMLIQSSVLIVILLLLDLLLRKKVKAVFRYWIWMLVLLKLILPTSLSSPLSLGYLFGEKLTYQDLAQSSPRLEPTVPAPAEFSSGVGSIYIQPNPYIPPAEPVVSVTEPVVAETIDPPPEVPVTPLSWQGVVFLVWLAVVIAMGLLLLQRALFVRGLVAQAKKAGHLMNDALSYCCESMGINSKVGLKISVNATTPSVCGLIRPVILVPWKLTSTLGASRLRTILMHELAHIRRGDLWVNLAQTALQIIYFYNPLLWLANFVIRRIREQAVDEAVLVAMGEKAPKYPQTLVDVAKMAFKRPALGLRLIGVVESRSALAGRIKHILGRPMPKTARLGIVSVLSILITAAVLLPMAKGQSSGIGLFDRKTLVKFESDDKPTGVHHKIGGIDIYQRTYKVDFKKNEKLVVIAELYQVGKPMRRLGCKVFDSSNKTQDLSVTLKSKYLKDIKTSVGHNIEVKMNDQSLRIDSFKVDTPTFFNNRAWNFFDKFSTKNGAAICIEERYGNKYVELNSLAMLRAFENFDNVKGRAARIWMPTYNNVSWVDSNAYFIHVNMFPLSQLEQLDIDVPRIAEKMQLPDGSYLPAGASKDVCKAVAEKYYEDIKLEIIRQSMPLPMARAHSQADLEVSVEAAPLDHFVGKYAIAGHPDTAAFEIKKEGDVFIFRDFGGPKFEMDILLRGLDGRKFEMEKGRDNLRFGNNPRERYSVRYNAAEDRYILDSLGMRGEVQDGFVSPLTDLVKISAEKPEDIFAATLPNGVTVELIGICEHPSIGKQWWQPDGTIWEDRPYEEFSSHNTSGQKGYELVWRLISDEDVVYEVESADQRGSAGQDVLHSERGLRPALGNGEFYGVVFFFSQTLSQAPINIGVGLDRNWKTIASLEGSVSKASSSINNVHLYPPIEADGRTYIDAAYRFPEGKIQAYRLVAVDKSNKQHIMHQGSETKSRGIIHCRKQIDLPLKQIKTISFQSQPLQWVTFENVSLRPGLKTDVQVEVEEAEPVFVEEIVTAKVRPDLRLGIEETISPEKLVMLLIVLNSCAPETDLNIESVSIKENVIKIGGDTSDRTNTRKFLEEIEKNGLKISQLRLDTAKGNRDKFNLVVEPKQDWQKSWRQRKTDVQLGFEENISPKLVMLLVAIKSVAAEMDLNIESLSISAKSMNIEGDTSGRKDTLKFLDAIKDNGLEVSRLNYVTRDNRNKFSVVAEPKENWRQGWQKHKADIKADFRAKEDVVSKPPQPELLSAKPPIVAYDVKLNFADPTVRDGSFHSEQSIAFCLSFHNIEIPPAGKFTMSHLLIGQTTWPVHLEDNGITIKEGVAGQKISSLKWPAGEPRFDKVIKIPVKYGNREYSCPVHIELDRRDKEHPIGAYWFCAYLSGRLPWGAGGRGFEIVNLDQQMEFRLTGDGTDTRDAVLGIDINGDGRIDPAKEGGEQFDLYEPFIIGSKVYQLAEVDPYLPRVVFREVDALILRDSLAKTDVPVEVEKTSQSQSSTTLPNGVTIEQAATIRVPEDYTLDAAVKAAKDGDTLIVSAGQYHGEDVLIEPKLEIEVEKTASNDSGGDSKSHQHITFIEGMSIREALRFLGKAYKKNIIPSEKVAGQVPVNELYNVTFEEALQAIIGTHKYITDGNFIRVYTEEEFEFVYPEEKTNSQVKVEKPAGRFDNKILTPTPKNEGTLPRERPDLTLITDEVARAQRTKGQLTKPEIIKTSDGRAKLMYLARHVYCRDLANLVVEKNGFITDKDITCNEGKNQISIVCPTKGDAETVFKFLQEVDVEPIKVRMDLLVIETYPDVELDWETREAVRNITHTKTTSNAKPGESLSAADILRETAKTEPQPENSIEKLVDLLTSRGYLKILMNPTLEVVNGKTAKVQSSQRLPTGKEIINSFEITPQILDDGNIDVATKMVFQNKQMGDPRTHINIKDSESLVIGSVTKTYKRDIVRDGVKGSEERTTEVLVILTLTIITPEMNLSKKSDMQVKDEQRNMIHGVVRDQFGDPVLGVLVLPMPHGGHPVKTGPDGEFEIAGPSENRRIETLFVRDIDNNQATVAQLSDFNQPLDITLTSAITVTGRITDPNGMPIAGAKVHPSVHNEGDGWYAGFGHTVFQPTNNEGIYEIKALPTGPDYEINIGRVDGYGGNTVRLGLLDLPGRKKLDDIVLEPANLSVSGIVLDNKDKPVANVVIQASGKVQPTRKVKTDSKGRFKIDGVCKGRVELYAWTSDDLWSGTDEVKGGDQNIEIFMRKVRQTCMLPPESPPVSLVGKAMPSLETLGIQLPKKGIEGKRILVCFWKLMDDESRDHIRQLARKTDELAKKNIVIVAAQIWPRSEKQFRRWLEKNNVKFPVSMLPDPWKQKPEQRATYRWGMQGYVPWLVLTDNQHVVSAEGFSIDDLNEKIRLSEKSAVQVKIQEKKNQKELSKFTRTLPNGVTVELVGICEYPSAGKQWRRPDGTPFTLPAGIKVEDRISTARWGDNAYQFLFRYNSQEDLTWNSLEAVCLHFSIEGDSGVSLINLRRLPKDGQDGLFAKVAIFKEPMDSTTIQANLATGNWQTQAVRDISKIDQRNEDLYWFTSETPSIGLVSLDILHRIEGQQIKTIAIDREGNEYNAGYSLGSFGGRVSISQIEGRRYHASVRKDDRLVKFKLQSRPFWSSVIGNVSLKPNFKTAVQVEEEKGSSEIAEGTPIYKKTIRFTAVVTKIMEFNPSGNHDTFAVEDDPRFILFLQVTAAEPPNYWFQPGRDVDFLIHDPVALFGGEQKEVVGKSYYFVMGEAMDFVIEGDMERRHTLLSVKPLAAKPKPDVPVEVEGTGEENEIIWGKPSRGLQVGISVEKEKWRIGGDVPRLNVEVRISDPKKFQESGLAAKAMAHDWSAFALEIDGKRYKKNVFTTVEPGQLRSPFKIPLFLDDQWQGGPGLTPGRHKIRVLFVGLGMRVASEPVEIEILPEDKKLEPWPYPWGKAVKGVQVSAHPARLSWPVGSEPVIRICLRNKGKEKWSIHEAPSSFALEVDGKRYENNFIFHVWRRPFAPGDVYQFDLKLSKSKSFHDGLRKGNSWPPVGKPPPLLPGKHTVRVLFTELRIEPEPASRPVEFEIIPAGSNVHVELEKPVVGEWKDVGNPIPADFNDTIALTEQITLVSIGQDVEGKTFITFVWDREKDRNRQYRFVLINKKGTVFEPDSHMILDENGRLQEKFTFDEPHVSWRLKEFKFQRRPLPLAGNRSISSKLQKETSTAFEGKTISPSKLAPPGRYAIELDGVDDYLLVPDSQTLRLEPPFTVEMWIKPKLPEQKPDHLQQWGVIAQGGYIGTGRVKTRGFGIEFTRFEKEPATFHISYTEANESGLFGKDYGNYLFDEWMHISHVFEGENYMPSHGHPLVIGRFLIPMPEPFMGQIGEVRIWKGARTREEIRRYKNRALTGKESGLAACWTFEQAEGQFAYDISGNNNHARFGRAIEADGADPKWIDLEAPAHQPRVKSDVQTEGGVKDGGLTVFESYFPDDADAGRKLDQWWENRGRNPLDDEEFFELFRKGLRRTTVKYKGNFLMQHIGGGYIWHKDPDDKRAIDIVYHASFSPEYKYYAVYSGLSVADPKSEKVLKRLVDLAMEYHQLGRILWGVKQSKQEAQFIAFLEPYLQASDLENRERAGIVAKALRGEIDANKWEREWNQMQKTERTVREFGDELPKIKKTFLSGTSEDRLKAIKFIRKNAITLTFDQSFIRALDACSQDSDANVRAGAANFLGYNYIWGKDVEPKEVIEILLRLSKDEDRQVRYNTVYSGLSVVNEKDATVIKRLVELALTDHENNLYGRIVWGLRGPVRIDRKLVERILAEQLDEVKSDLHRQASLYFLYKELFNTEPPGTWDLEDAAGRYPREVFGICFSPREPFRPESKNALWEEFYTNLPDDIDVQRFPVDDSRKLMICVKVQGQDTCDKVTKMIENSPRLRAGQAIPLGPRMQLYFEELQRIKPGPNSNFNNQSEEPSKDKSDVHVEGGNSKSKRISENMQDSFLDAQSILEGWKSVYGNIKSMRVSYVERVVDTNVPPDNPHILDNLVKVNRVQGSTDKLNLVQVYMCLDEKTGTYKHGKMVQIPRFQRLMEWAIKVGLVSISPQLEKVAGEPCHLININWKVAETEYRIWVAHNKGMYPIKRQRFAKGKLAVEVGVEELAKTSSSYGDIWYPKVAYRIVNSQTKGTQIKQRLDVEQFVPNIEVDDEASEFATTLPNGETEDTSWMGRISSTGKIRRPVVPVANKGGNKPQESIKDKPRKQEGSEHPGRISGVVINSDTGEPIVGAYVGVGDFGDSGGSNYSRHRSEGFYDKTKTDAEGRFELGGLVFTDKHRYLKYHPLVVTHPDFVRHDRKIELPSDGPAPDVKVNLVPAAKIEVTIVDADGNPLPGQWLVRLEALDGRRFIPPGSDPHLSSFASNIWAHWPDLRNQMGVSNGFTFTELDTGEYSIEALKFQLFDKPTPGNIWKPTITYHGSIPNIRVQAGQTKHVKLAPQDHQTRLTITAPEFPDKLFDKLERSSQMPLMCLISRSPGALLWDDGKIRHLEDQRLGRIDKKRFFRGFFIQGKPLTINNLPPDSYSLFTMAVYGQVAGYLIGARADLAKGDDITLDIPWRQPTGPSIFGPNRSFDYPVNLEAREYRVSELCGILTEITQSNPRIIADSSIENEKLSFGRGQMSVWDVLEKLYLDRGWTVEEGQDKTLIIKPAEQTNAPVEDSLGQARVVHFPADRSLGMLCVHRETIGAPVHWWWGLHSQWQYLRSPWQYLAEARGEVTVPAGKHLGLIVGRDGIQNLSDLAKLRPDVLYMLKIKCGENAEYNPGDDCMPNLVTLTGLKELILEYPGITNEGLRLIKGLSSLERLSLISGQLDDTGMAHIAELESLKGLRFYGRNVTNAGLSHLSKLTSLEELFPSGGINDEGLVHLTKLPALRYLHMYSVRGGLTENGLVHFKNIPSLKKLELGSFGFRGEGLAHISRIPGLEDLSINNTVLSDEDLVPLKSMNSLKRLSLSPAIQQMAPNFTDEALFHLSRVKSLESLVLGYGKFTDKGLEHLTELDNLKCLDIPNNSGFTDAGLSHLTKLPLIEELKLRANQFTDVGMSSIAKITNLKRLDLWGHRADITNKGLARLADMSRLSYLVIKGNFDDEGLAHVGNLNQLSYLDISGDFTDEGLHRLEGLNLLKQLKISSPSKLSPQALQGLHSKLPNLLVLN